MCACVVRMFVCFSMFLAIDLLGGRRKEGVRRRGCWLGKSERGGGCELLRPLWLEVNGIFSIENC